MLSLRVRITKYDSAVNADDNVYYSTDDDIEDGFSRAKVRGENHKQKTCKDQTTKTNHA